MAQLPSGYLLHSHGKSPFLRTVNHLFPWAIYTMAMLNNQRVTLIFMGLLHDIFHRLVIGVISFHLRPC